jgi:hypothetical protein
MDLFRQRPRFELLYTRRVLPKQALDPDRIVGLNIIVNDAVALKYTPTTLAGPEFGGTYSNSPAPLR